MKFIEKIPEEIRPEIIKKFFSGIVIFIASIIISITFQSAYFVVLGFILGIAFCASGYEYVRAFKKNELRKIQAIITAKDKKLAPMQKNVHNYTLYCRDEEGNQITVTVKRQDYIRYYEGSPIVIYCTVNQLHIKESKFFTLQGYLKLE